MLLLVASRGALGSKIEITTSDVALERTRVRGMFNLVALESSWSLEFLSAAFEVAFVGTRVVRVRDYVLTELPACPIGSITTINFAYECVCAVDVSCFVVFQEAGGIEVVFTTAGNGADEVAQPLSVS